MDNDNKKDGNCQSDVYFAVYVIYCLTTEKYYVGITSRRKVELRIQEHKKGKQFVDIELKKVGWENCDWWVVEELIPAENIDEYEKKWVAYFDCVYPKGYNRTHGEIGQITVSEDTREKMSKSKRGKPSNRNGQHHTETAKLKLRKAHIGKHLSPETRTKISESNKGKHHSPETRAKISESNKGKEFSDERRAKISDATKGEKHRLYGKHHSAETRAKISESNKGKKHSDETRAKLSELHKGKKASPETRAKMSESHKRENLSDETRAKISAATKGENHPMYGKHHSAETRAKISATLKARAAAKRAAKLAETAAAENSENQTTS